MTKVTKKDQIHGRKKPTVSVIMNVYRRGNRFKEQLESIMRQTFKPSEILIWQNGADEISAPTENTIISARNSSNLGVWARFAYALNAKSEFIWMIDDDVLPGSRWLENALQTYAKSPGVIGSRGLIFHSSRSYSLYDEFGPNFPNNDIVEVDIVGHNWIFPKSYLAEFWGLLGNKFNSPLAGEDIHLSYALQRNLGIGTFVPPHPLDDQELWGELRLPAEESSEVAISKSRQALGRFEDAYAHYIKLGFSPLVSRRGKEKLMDKTLGSVFSRAPQLAHDAAKLLGIKKRL